jgi:hypothetical protein
MQQFWISKRWKESIIYKELWYNRTQMNNRNGTSFSCLSAYSNTETTCFNIKWHMFWNLIKERLEPDCFFSIHLLHLHEADTVHILSLHLVVRSFYLLCLFLFFGGGGARGFTLCGIRTSSMELESSLGG